MKITKLKSIKAKTKEEIAKKYFAFQDKLQQKRTCFSPDIKEQTDSAVFSRAETQNCFSLSGSGSNLQNFKLFYR